MQPRTPDTAFVLGAGLGTRLRPLTEHFPKPLVPVCGKPLITFAFDHLHASDIRRFIVNTHHCASRYREVFPDNTYRGMPIRFRHEEDLLDTGGGIKNIEDLVGPGTLLVYNGDILTDLPLEKAIAAHCDSSHETTLVLRSGGGPQHVRFDPATGCVTDIRARLATGGGLECVYTGIMLMEPEFFRRIPAGKKISVVEIWLRMLADGVPMGGVLVDEGTWRDLGTREELDAVQHEVVTGGWRPSFPVEPGWPGPVANGTERLRLQDLLRQSLGTEELELTALDKGGSDRKFYRLHQTGKPPRVVLHYIGEQAEENERYYAVANFLPALGVRAPRVHHFDPGVGLLVMEDLGENDLWAIRHAPWPERFGWNVKALRQVARLHAKGMAAWEAAPFPLHVSFEEELYRWEREYFVEHCLGRHFRLGDDHLAAVRDDVELNRMAVELAARPRVLVHRDFQSQNVMLSGGEAWLIDFQGMRPGLAEYDVASLLYDPYVAFSDEERARLVGSYVEAARAEGRSVAEDFPEVLDLCAIQRLMQALGAYGFLGLSKGKSRFLEFIPVALRSLAGVSRRSGRFPGLDGVLRDLLESGA